MNEITHIISRIEQGDRAASNDLLPLVYEELRQLAAARMAAEQPGHTLTPTALVHEAYLRLVQNETDGPPWDSRRHFFVAAAEAMRRILVEHARRKRGPQRGGDQKRVEFEESLKLVESNGDVDLMDLDEALAELHAVDQDSAEVVKLKYFTGLSVAEISNLLQVSQRTVERRWAYARAWLHQRLEGKE